MLQPQSTIIITALVFSLLGGIVVAFLMESLDTGLRSIAEIESITELPSLAIIPRARRSAAEEASNLSTAQRNISVLTQPKSQFAEAFRSLRTSLLLSNAGQPAEVHPVYQRYSVRRQDDDGEQSGVRSGTAGRTRSADRRGPSPAQCASSVWVERKGRPDDSADRRNAS